MVKSPPFLACANRYPYIYWRWEFKVMDLKAHRHRAVRVGFLWEIVPIFFYLEKCEILKHTSLSISHSFCLPLENKVQASLCWLSVISVSASLCLSSGSAAHRRRSRAVELQLLLIWASSGEKCTVGEQVPEIPIPTWKQLGTPSSGSCFRTLKINLPFSQWEFRPCRSPLRVPTYRHEQQLRSFYSVVSAKVFKLHVCIYAYLWIIIFK